MGDTGVFCPGEAVSGTRKHVVLSIIELSLAPIGAAIWLSWGQSTLPNADASRMMVIGILAVVALLAVRFRRGRGFLLAVVLALIGATRFAPETVERLVPMDLHPSSIAVVVPVLLLVLAILPERPALGRPGLFRAVWLFAVSAAAIWQLSTPNGARAQEALPDVFSPLVLCVAVSLITAVIAWVRGTAFERSAAVILPCLGLYFSAEHQTAVIWLLAASIVLLISLSQTTAALAFRDELTGLPARRALEEALRDLKGEYALAMVDIDHFKKLNDRFGHQVGDQALRMIAAKVAGVTGGQAYRYGGEEFAVIFPRLELRQAKQNLESLRETIANNRFVLRSRSRPRKKPPTRGRTRKTTKGVKVTVSIGVADPGAKRRLPRQVLKVADQQLYRAKRAGRNQVRAKSA